MTDKEEKPTISQLYNIGDFIDAKDNQGDWRVGFIVQKNDIIKTFKVRFDGWPAKYDQIYRFGTPKLEQFRCQVLGYTGQKQYPALRQGWKYSQTEHQDVSISLMKKMMELYHFNFNKKESKIQSARHLNQWIRGHNYFYVDFLMTLTFESVQQAQRVLQFLKLNLSLCINYLKYIVDNFATFLQHLDLNNNQHLEDITVAKSFAFYEIFDTVYTITGLYPRQNGFFKDNDQILRQAFASTSKDVKTTYQIKMVDFFFKNGGIQAIDNLILLIKKHNRSIRFMFLNSLAHLYNGLSCVIQAKPKENFVKNLRSITQKNIEFLGDKQMKDFHHHEVVELINQIFEISKKTSIEAEVQNWSKLVEMEIYFKMITCSFFEKKLRGITSFHQFIERKVQLHKEKQTHDLIEDGTLSKWIEQKKFFDILFANDNPELIKKSTELIKYLYQRDNKMEKYIEMIWKYREGKHETALKEIYNFIAEIPTYDRNEQFTVKLFKKYISQVDQNSWDQEYVKMIKDYTVSALYIITSQNIKETFGFDIIYKYAQKNSSDETLLGYFIDICRRIAGTSFMQKFIIQCFKHVEKNNNAGFHVSLLVRLLRQKMVEPRSINLDGASIIVENIVLSRNIEKENLDQKFQLLATYLRKAQEVIPKEAFINFWNQMIDSKGRASFFRWIYKSRNSGQIYIPPFINQETKCFLIEHFWTDEYLIKHPIDEWEAILLLEVFKLVNKIQEKIMREGMVFEVMNENLTGLEKVHSAYKLTKDPRACEILAKGLAQIYTSGSTILEEDLEIDLVQIFTQRIFQETKIYSQKNDIEGIKKMIRLVEEIINRDEEIYDVQQTIRIQQMKTFQVKHTQKNDQRFFRVNIVSNIYSFKRLIAEKYEIPIHKFDMIINQDEIVTYKHYFKTIGQAQIKGKILIRPKQNENSPTKNKLNHHLELLFELMDNKEIQERVWNIVSKLPISDQIRSKIIQSENQLKILQNTSFYRELYMFKVALSLQKKWWIIQPQQMASFFLSRLQKTPTSTEIQREYLMVSAKLLQRVFQLDEVANPKFFSDTFVALFEVAKRILVQINSIENLNTGYIKKFVESFFTIGEIFNKYLEKKGLKQTETDALSLLLKDKNIQNLLKLCFIEYRHEAIRKQFPIRLVRLANVNKERYANRLAGIILNDLLDCTVTTENKNFKEFNLLFSYILQTMGEHLKKFYAEHKGVFFNKLCNLTQSQPPEQNSDTTSNALYSYLSLIRFVIQEVPQADLQKFFAFIYKECLFKGNLSKCKSKQTRTAIFNYFIKLIRYKKNVNRLFGELGLLHVNGPWRSRKLQDWTITHSERLKSSTGYTGLRNLGCICYMNSFFQQIFMIEEFRRALLLSEDPSYDPTTVDENVLYQVKKMFMNLMFSDRKAYNPKSFCMSFKDYEGNPTNVNEQMDIDEFSGILLDRLQNSLKGTKYPNLIKDTFGGIFSNEIICKGCPHFSQTQESFLSLALTVKDKKSIYESLQTMIKGDTLDGDNAYYCQRCAKKVSAVKRVCLKSLPNYLMVALKRFQFDFNTMQKLKVNQYCEFPHQLNLQEYSYEYLRKKENPKFESQQMRSEKYYEYKLKGVVIHIGYADSGHYYSLIQERSGEERWLEFNDTVVRKFNIENLNDEAFGGQTGGLESKQKIKNAYLLIYERVQKINSIKDQVMNLGNSFINMEMYSEVVSTIQKQNFQYNIENILFSNEYVRFISNMIEQAAKNQQTNFNLQKFIILAFLTTTMRSKTDPTSFELIQKIWNSFGKGNLKLNLWIIQQFCDPKIYDELFRNCPIRQTKRNLVSWTILMLKELPDPELKIRLFKTIILKITTENENNAEGITILHSFVDEPECLGFFVENNIVGRIHENIIRRDPRVFGGIDNLVPGPNDAPSEFGYEQIIQKTPFELKKNKYDNEQGIVWAFMYKLISNFKKADLANHLHPKQVEYLTLSKQAIYRILGQLKSKFDIDVFTNYLLYLSEGDLVFSQMLAELVQKGLKELQSKKYRQFFELFKKLIPIEDGFSDQRVTWIFHVIRSLKQNEKYAMDCTIIELWLCKVVNQNQKLATYLMAQKNVTEYLSGLPLKRIPSDQLSKKNASFNDTIINKYHGIPFPTSRRGYIKLLKHVEEFYEKLLKGVYEPMHFFESGNHVVYDKLGAGDKLAYFDQKDKVDFEEATIKQVFLDKFCITRKSLPNRPFWVWSDDERLTLNLNVIKDQNSHELDSSKTTEMQDQIDFEGVI